MTKPVQPLYIDISSSDTHLDILVDPTYYPEVAEQILQLLRDKPGLMNAYIGRPLTNEMKYGIKYAIEQTIQSYVNSGEGESRFWPVVVVRIKRRSHEI